MVALVLALCWGAAGGQAEPRGKGDFVAGSFILTQKALSEAPYRYSRSLDSREDPLVTNS